MHSFDVICDDTCNGCNYTRTVIHTFGEYTYNNDATCVEDGTKTATCICGKTKTIKSDNTATGIHIFGEYIYNNDATTEKDGTKTAICNNCNITDTITAEGTKKLYIDSTKQFNDVPKGKWYVEAISYAVTYGIFTGTSETTFEPNKNMTRAQFVQVFANLAGTDTSDRNVDSGLTDVPKGKWFTGAVTWAAKNGVVNGIGDGKFDPNADVTRQQMCVMLVNFVENFMNDSLKRDKNVSSFADDKDIAKWSKEQVYKCAKSGLVNGVGNNKFDPKASATRAQGATIFTNFYNHTGTLMS